jgi:hypothetical protein
MLIDLRLTSSFPIHREQKSPHNGDDWHQLKRRMAATNLECVERLERNPIRSVFRLRRSFCLILGQRAGASQFRMPLEIIRAADCE